MSKPTRLIGMLLLAALCNASSQDLNQAEVRISYGELKQLLTRAEPAEKPKKPDPALLSARLVFSIENGRPSSPATSASPVSMMDSPSFR
jgi:hypothetical protein